MLVLMWDLGGGSQHGRGGVLRAEEVEVDVGEADVVPHLVGTQYTKNIHQPKFSK